MRNRIKKISSGCRFERNCFTCDQFGVRQLANCGIIQFAHAGENNDWNAFHPTMKVGTVLKLRRLHSIGFIATSFLFRQFYHAAT
ncbi:hypothetical protein ACFQ3K_13640 [Brucella gallinifaecis]|uniref:hypothetical protein n=1 Tax=Brucella gallinifaecis TaxID=215590 RepID=UPI00112992AD